MGHLLHVSGNWRIRYSGINKAHKTGAFAPAERGNMNITEELARAVKYYMIMENALFENKDFKEAHKNFVEKMEEYEKKENLTEEEAQYNIEIAAEAIKEYRAEQ